MNSHTGSSIIFLENNDFHIATGQKGNQILAINPNISKSVVFFYISQGCNKCATLMDPYKRLPLVSQTDVKFIISDVQRNDWAIARKSSPTSTPITNVPTFIFYVNGRPYRKYTGPLTHPDSMMHIYNFITQVSASIPDHIIKKVKPTQAEKEKLKGQVPGCTIGIPLYGDEDDLYPEICEAYPKKQGETKPQLQQPRQQVQQPRQQVQQPRQQLQQSHQLQQQKINPYKQQYTHPTNVSYTGKYGGRNQPQYHQNRTNRN